MLRRDATATPLPRPRYEPIRNGNTYTRLGRGAVNIETDENWCDHRVATVACLSAAAQL